MQYKEYLQTAHWKQRRQRAIDRAGGHCVVCRNGRKVDVHHNTYEHLWDEHDDDLAVLCEKCHKTFHLPPTPFDVPDKNEINTDFWPVVLMDDGTYRQGPDAEIVDGV